MVNAAYQRVSDRLMLGDASEALRMLAEFETAKF
jgi:hypothetical protein